MSYHREKSNYIPKREIDDVEDDEIDTNFIDSRRSKQKLKQLANTIPPKILKNKTLLEIKDQPYSVQKYAVKKNNSLVSRDE
jgi:hypothetical protein